MTGLEQLRAMIAGDLAPPSITKVIPLALELADEGYVEFSATATDALLNPMGGVHGGFAATALDSSTGCAVQSLLPPGKGYATVDLNVQMIPSRASRRAADGQRTGDQRVPERRLRRRLALRRSR